MGIFSRKNQENNNVKEERSESIGALLFSQGGGFGNSTAMKLSAFYCGVNQISNAVAMLPIDVAKYDNDEKRPISHPLWKLLNLSPDGKYNHFNVFKMAIESVILTGNAYFYIERDDRLNVKALRYINSDFVTPIVTEGSKVKYIVTGMKEAVDAINMIHLWMHVDESFNGISLIKYAYSTLKGAYDAENSAAKFYRGGVGLNGILKANATLTNEQKKQIRESWNQAFSVDGNGIAVLPAGLDYQSVQISPEDASLIDNREFNITEIARFLNISPIKLFNRKLVKPSEVGKIGVFFNFTSALSTNRQAEGEYYRMMLTNGIMTINEIRGRIGLPKIEDKAGDTHFVQISYGTAEDIAEGKYIKQNSQSQEQDKTDNKVKTNSEE